MCANGILVGRIVFISKDKNYNLNQEPSESSFNTDDDDQEIKTLIIVILNIIQFCEK